MTPCPFHSLHLLALCPCPYFLVVSFLVHHSVAPILPGLRPRVSIRVRVLHITSGDQLHVRSQHGILRGASSDRWAAGCLAQQQILRLCMGPLVSRQRRRVHHCQDHNVSLCYRALSLSTAHMLTAYPGGHFSALCQRAAGVHAPIPALVSLTYVYAKSKEGGQRRARVCGVRG